MNKFVGRFQNYRATLVALIIGLSLILSVWIGGQEVYKIFRKQEILVTGKASYNITSDIIKWGARYTTKNMDIKQGYESINQKRAVIMNYLRGFGLPDSCVTFESLEISRDYKTVYYESRSYSEFTGYILKQEFRIVSHDVEKVEEISRNVGELLDKDIYVEAEMPRYYYSKLDESKHELLKLASEDALNRADAIAKGSAKSVGKLISSQMGVFQIVGEYSEEDYEWSGNFNTSDKIKTISITVKNRYSIK